MTKIKTVKITYSPFTKTVRVSYLPFVKTIPVTIAAVPTTNVFVEEDGTTTFTTEDGQNFRTEN